MPSELSAQQVKTLKFGVRATNPVGMGEELGDLYFNDGTGVLPEGEYVYESTGWQIIGGGGPPVNDFPPTNYICPDPASENTANLVVFGGSIEFRGRLVTLGGITINVAGYADGSYYLCNDGGLPGFVGGWFLSLYRPTNCIIVGTLNITTGTWNSFTDLRDWVTAKGYEINGEQAKHFTSAKGVRATTTPGRASQRGIVRDTVSNPNMTYEYVLLHDSDFGKLLIRVVGQTVALTSGYGVLGNGHNESAYTVQLNLETDDPQLPITPIKKEFVLVQDNTPGAGNTYVVIVATHPVTGTDMVLYGLIPTGILDYTSPSYNDSYTVTMRPISDPANTQPCSKVSACLDANRVLNVCWKQETGMSGDINVGGFDPLLGYAMNVQTLIPSTQDPDNPTIESGQIETYVCYVDDNMGDMAYVRTTNAIGGNPGAPGYTWQPAPGTYFNGAYTGSSFSMVILMLDAEYVTVVYREWSGVLWCAQLRESTGEVVFSQVTITDVWSYETVNTLPYPGGYDGAFQLTTNNKMLVNNPKGNLMVLHIQETCGNETANFEAILSISDRAINPQQWAGIPIDLVNYDNLVFTPRCLYCIPIAGWLDNYEFLYPAQYYPPMVYTRFRALGAFPLLMIKDQPMREYLENDSVPFPPP